VAMKVFLTIATAARRSGRNCSGWESAFAAAGRTLVYRRNLCCAPTRPADSSSATPTTTIIRESLSGTSRFFSRNTTTSRVFSSETATVGRSRKRSRPWRRGQQQRGSPPSVGGETKGGSATGFDGATPRASSVHRRGTPKRSAPKNDNDDDLSLPYPDGKPWRVLWPRPHGDPVQKSVSSFSNLRQRIPTVGQLKKGWALYKETWEDGITGVPTTGKVDRPTTIGGVGESNNSGGASSSFSSMDPSSSPSMVVANEEQLRDIGDNAAKNLHIVRKDAQSLLEHTKETTGIRTQEDMKALASEAMKTATECIREFMTGYRKGRDTEIDKMLHEYFQEEEKTQEQTDDDGEKSEGNPNLPTNEDTANSSENEVTSPAAETRRRKKRKPKRGIPRG